MNLLLLLCFLELGEYERRDRSFDREDLERLLDRPRRKKPFIQIVLVGT